VPWNALEARKEMDLRMVIISATDVKIHAKNNFYYLVIGKAALLGGLFFNVQGG
jgi:hypothetical protein